MTRPATLCIATLAAMFASGIAFANGGPFLMAYPGGDTSAKGIISGIDPTLKPTTEDRLRVIKEDLSITFDAPAIPGVDSGLKLPLADVIAKYTIENPTDQQIEVHFGFPVLRGMYVSPFSMMPIPHAEVHLDENYVHANIISNSAIYGVIRQLAREAIEDAVAKDDKLTRLVSECRTRGLVRTRARKTIRDAASENIISKAVYESDRQLSALLADAENARDEDLEAVRAELAAYLKDDLRWEEADVALMVEFASLDFGQMRSHPPDRDMFFWGGGLGHQLIAANLGPLSAIGEQKATQYFAKLASCFDPKHGQTYESIFTAWGGDVRERSVDIQTGKLRPREYTIPEAPREDTMTEKPHENPAPARRERSERFVTVDHPAPGERTVDPTIYARIDYFDENAPISDADKDSCRTILKNLPVIFTFAPMNLIHYTVAFPPNATKTLSVRYHQYAFEDTREPATYQLAYVIHPASLWKEFGPINLEVAVPEGIAAKASVETELAGTGSRKLERPYVAPPMKRVKEVNFAFHTATIHDKTGELFIALDKKAWDNAPAPEMEPPGEARR